MHKRSTDSLFPQIILIKDKQKKDEKKNAYPATGQRNVLITLIVSVIEGEVNVVVVAAALAAVTSEAAAAVAAAVTAAVVV